ncbi:virulence RhuM family protein [Accumulibacter sp.]|uniref:virulence RhuM family protein n=1 Tax=Accumulibacter sp. TaxID=2053492 RepID=UPI0035AF8D6C
MSDKALPQSEFILYQTEDGRTRIQCRFDDETLWLTQIQIAELFQTTVPNINLHLKAIYAEGELAAEATIKSHLIVRHEGSRQVSRPVLHYSLPVILAVGFRVRSQRGTQFRQWATARLGEFLVNGSPSGRLCYCPRHGGGPVSARAGHCESWVWRKRRGTVVAHDGACHEGV